MQRLEDEPQFANSDTYQRLCAFFKSLVPGVGIIDPTESPFIEGTCKIASLKQALYLKHRDGFEALR